MTIKRFRLGDSMDFTTDDAGMEDIEAVEVFLTEKFEMGLVDEETGITYYLENGSVDIEPLPEGT